MSVALPGPLRSLGPHLRRRWQTRPRLTPPVPVRPVRLENRAFAFTRQLDATRRKYLWERTLFGLGWILTLVVPFFGLRCALDWWLEMPWMLRLACLCAEGLFTTAALYKYVLWLRLHPPSDEEVALLIERQHHSLRTRLIATIQLNQPGRLSASDSPALVRALTQQTERMVARMKFAQAVPMDRIGHLWLRATSLVVLVFTLFFVTGDTGLALARRALLSTEAVPRKTQIEILTERHIVGLGEDLTLRARASGLVPEAGEVRIEYASGRTQTLRLELAEGASDTFERVVLAVPESFEYVLYLGDARSAPQAVTTRDKPGIRRVQARYRPPEYTGLPPSAISLQELDLLPGSTLLLSASSRGPLSGGEALLRGLGTTAPLQPTPDDPATVTARIRVPTENLNGVSVRVRDPDGVPSPESPVYPVRIVADQAPSIEVRFPVEVQQLVTADAKLLLSFHAVDDFRLGAVRLKYSVGNGPVQSEELDLGPRPGARQTRRYDWDLRTLSPSLQTGDLLQFWFEVADTNTVTGPGLAESRRYVARVVTRSEKEAELLSRLTDTLGTVSDVAAGQRDSNVDLGQFIQRKESER
ncbi:MAG: DUF4175 family protein [Opitutales bacterium]